MPAFLSATPTRTHVKNLPPLHLGQIQVSLWVQAPIVRANEVIAEVGVETIAFSPRIIGVDEAAAMLRILRSTTAPPVAMSTVTEEDPADFVRSIAK